MSKRTVAPGIQVYAGKRGKRYYVSALDSTGAQISLGASATLNEAKAIRADYLSLRNKGAAPVASSHTVKTLWVVYEAHLEALVASRELRPASLLAVRQQFQVHILGVLGETKLKELNKASALDLVDALRKKKLAPSTVRHIVTALSGLLDFALDKNIVSVNAARQLGRKNLPAPDEAPARALTPDEGNKLVAASSERWKLPIEVALRTGCRAGELLALQWQDLDLDAGLIRVERQLTRTGELAPTKTRKGVRGIPISPELVAKLRKAKLASPIGTEFVFSEPDGRPRSHHNLFMRVRGYGAKAGLGNVTPHVLRHSFASALLSRGLDVVTVAELMGHSRPSQTLDCYAHFLPTADKFEQVRAALA